MKNLRTELIKLAHENPELRADLLPMIKEGATQSPKAIAKWSIDMLEEVVITLVAPGGGAKDYDPEIWGYEADASLADTYGDIQKAVNLLKKANALLARVR